MTRPSIIAALLVVAAACAHAEAPADYAAEIRELGARADVQRALARASALERASLDWLVALTEVPAPPFGEAARAARFAELARTLGYAPPEVDAVGNVLIRLRGREPEHGRTIAVVAHLDSVFPEGTDVRVRREGDRFSAPGIADNARGLVLLLLLLAAIEDSGISTDAHLLLVASVGEEGIGDLRGVKHLLRAGGPRVDELIAIDGGDDARVLNQAIGSLRYRIEFRGSGGHSWGAFGLANPAHALATAIHLFDLEARAVVRGGPRTSYNIGRIGGGTAVNAVPFESWAEVDLRSERSEPLDQLDLALAAAVADALERHNADRSLGDPLTVALQKIGERPSGVVDPATPLIERALAATRYLGVEPELGAGSTDANVAIARGIPATTISRGGSSGGAHSPAEWWSAAGATLGVQRALLLVLASAGVE